MNDFDNFILPMMLLERKQELDTIVDLILSGNSISANLSSEECNYIIERLSEKER